MTSPEQLYPELSFQTSRSGGKGGQNVNKVESKVELRFDIPNSKILEEDQKQVLLKKLSNRITSEGVVVLYHQTERSQLANKELVTEKFYQLVARALTKETPRKPTKPTFASVLAKRNAKKRLSERKADRRRGDWD